MRNVPLFEGELKGEAVLSKLKTSPKAPSKRGTYKYDLRK
jgi:hypothetical protein